jgi:hypothetical protein
MKPLIRKIDFTLAFLTEYIALLIVAFPILDHRDSFMSHLWPTFLMAVVMFLIHIWAGRVHPVIFLPATLLSILAGLIMGLSLDITLVFGLLLLWRTFDVFKGLTFERLWIILTITFGLSIAYSHGLPLFINALPNHRELMPLLVIETLSVFITQLVFMGFRQKAHRGRLTRSYLILSVSLMAFLIIIGQALSDFFNNLMRHFGSDYNQPTSKSLHPKMNFQKEAPGPLRDYQLPHWFIYTISAVGAIILVLLIWGLVKGNWGRGYFQKGTRSEMVVGHVERLEGASSKKSIHKKRHKAPKDPVRLELYRFERQLRKSPHGRNQYDTIHSWFQRLPMKDRDKDIITSIYEKVRYGYKKITKSEWEVYQVAMESAKSDISNRSIKK